MKITLIIFSYLPRGVNEPVCGTHSALLLHLILLKKWCRKKKLLVLISQLIWEFNIYIYRRFSTSVVSAWLFLDL